MTIEDENHNTYYAIPIKDYEALVQRIRKPLLERTALLESVVKLMKEVNKEASTPKEYFLTELWGETKDRKMVD